ncbi:MAG: precorrin-6A/cobalt-precorrin-6A reductase [Pseudomonadota bacterium]
MTKTFFKKSLTQAKQTSPNQPFKGKILLLGGTGFSLSLANYFIKQGFCGHSNLIYAIKALTHKPALPSGCVIKKGGFGQGRFDHGHHLALFLTKHRVTHLIDTTHPHARVITQNAFEAARATHTHYLYARPPKWVLPPHLKYHETDHAASAMHFAGRNFKRVFCTHGRQALELCHQYPQSFFWIRLASLPDFKTATAPIIAKDGILLLNHIMDAPNATHINGQSADQLGAHTQANHKNTARQTLKTCLNAQLIIQKGPFRAEDERALIQKINPDLMIVKQSDGILPDKLKIAALCQIPVLLIKPPLIPHTPLESEVVNGEQTSRNLAGQTILSQALSHDQIAAWVNSASILSL